MPSADPPPPSEASSKPFSISLGSKAKPKPTPVSKPSPLNTKKRPHSALADPDSENEEISAVHEAVTGFDSGKATSVGNGAETKAPLVIKAVNNRDWREESRRKRGKNLLSAMAHAAQDGSKGQSEAGSNEERSEVSTEGGLKIVPRKEDADGDTPMTDDDQGTSAAKQTTDEEAIAALLGAKKNSTLTIPSQDEAAAHANGPAVEDDDYANESDRFRADVESRPPPASLSDYAAVPVEEFGAAILRGLGWKEGMAVGKRSGQAAKPPKEVQRRTALLGLGAKEIPGGVPGEELGAWGGGKKGRGKEKVAYNPVMLRDTVTGELLTEEEVALRKSEAKQKQARGKGAKIDDDWRERRDRNLKIDERKKDDRRGEEKERQLMKNGESRSGSSLSKRDRSRERDRDRENHRKRDHKRDRSRSDERSRHGSSRRERTRSRERSKYGSSKRERSSSMERKHRRRDDDAHDQKGRDRVRKKRDDDDYDRRDRDRDHRRH